MIGTLIGMAVYFAPAIVARARRHPNATSILVVNLFLGWTMIGWVLCLAWSVSALRMPDGRLPPAPLPVTREWKIGYGAMFAMFLIVVYMWQHPVPQTIVVLH